MTYDEVEKLLREKLGEQEKRAEEQRIKDRQHFDDVVRATGEAFNLRIADDRNIYDSNIASLKLVHSEATNESQHKVAHHEHEVQLAHRAMDSLTHELQSEINSSKHLEEFSSRGGPALHDQGAQLRESRTKC